MKISGRVDKYLRPWQWKESSSRTFHLALEFTSEYDALRNNYRLRLRVEFPGGMNQAWNLAGIV